MRNLFVGYFQSPKTKRSDVLRLMGGVLGLTREDIEKVSDTWSCWEFAQLVLHSEVVKVRQYRFVTRDK